MKPHPDLVISEILEAFQNRQPEPPQKVGDPISYEERMVEYQKMLEIAQNPDNIRTLCVGCGADTMLTKSAACECGGFVCEDCQRLEEDGVCNHEAHVL